MSDRDEFEAWAKGTMLYRLALARRSEDDEYMEFESRQAWRIWKAARASPQQAVPVLTWVGLTDKERDGFVDEIVMHGTGFVTPLYAIIEEIEGLLRAKNAAAPQPSKEETK